jgi:hypothetical protein
VTISVGKNVDSGNKKFYDNGATAGSVLWWKIRECVMPRLVMTYALVAASVFFITADIASAGFTNGGFESGGTSWSQSNVQPFAGGGSTSITFPSSGTAAQGAGYAHFDCLVIGPQFTGPGSGSYQQGSSTLSQTFTANAGDWVSFDFRINQLSANGGSLYDDAALIVTCGTYNVQTRVEPLNNNVPPYRFLYQSGQPLGNGWYSYSIAPFTTAGTYTFSVQGYAEAEGQPGGASTSHLIADIDAVTLNPVPEPSTFALLGVLAAGGMVYALRRRLRL